MRYVLMVVGYGWALLGLGNLVGMFGQGVSDGVATFGLLVNVLLFILPGLAIGGIGQWMARSARRAAEHRETEEDRVRAAVQAALAEERAKAVGSRAEA